MAKWIAFFSLFILVIVCSFFGYLYTSREEFASYWLTKALGTNVQIKSIELSKKGIIVRNFTISNPPSFTQQRAFSAKEIAIELNWLEELKALLGISGKGIEIKRIAIDSPELGIELTGTLGAANNWQTLLAASTSSPNETASRTFIIRECLLTNIQLIVENHTLIPIALHPEPIARLEFTNIGSDKALTTKQLLHGILSLVVQDALKEIHVVPGINQDKVEKASQKLNELFQQF